MQRVVVFALILLGFSTPSWSQDSLDPTIVDVELVLAADGSGSIDDAELALQRKGYADALAHPEVQRAIQGGLYGRIAVAFVEWGGPTSQHTIVDWTVIGSEADARAFGERLLAAPRAASGWNSISEAIAYSTALIKDNEYRGLRRVIDVSGDGPQIGGRPLPIVRATANALNITVNALVVKSRGGGFPGPRGEPLETHYRNDVVTGPGAFVMVADENRSFAEAVRRKLVLEIALK
jgi:hypothetical protein